ncbi:sensor histidine kinase [Cytobacillus gottheilii]|uniref:sensor histidine kinase n=1 Tax=Cytobacillus gottheilii TaxID=859144 RepID=UPI003CF9CCA6
MRTRIVYIGLCITHIMLATNGLLPLLLSSILAIAAAASTWKFVKLDQSIWIQLLIIVVYLINGPKIENIVLLIGSALLFIYSATMQKRLIIRTLNPDMDKQLHQFNETFQMVRKERHDYLKHVAAIQYLLEKEQFKEAKSYMANLLNRYEETNLSIKGEHGAIASVLHNHYKEARSENMAINYQLDVPISQLPIESADLVELVGNILENAVFACREWQCERGEQGFVELSLQKRSGLFLLTCKNSTLPLEREVCDQLFVTSGISTKEHHRGLGTAIIQEIVHNHKGFLDFNTEKNTFVITCKIPSVV